MEYGALLIGSKWDILKELSKKSSSPTELSAKLKTSIPNILQQLSLLEAHGLVEKTREFSKKPGKPRTIYTLKNELLHLSFIGGYKSKKLLIPLDKEDILPYLILQARLFDNQEDSLHLMKFFFLNEELLRKCDAVAFFKSNQKEIELLIITENLALVREKISNQFIKVNEKEMKLIVWSHNQFEVEDGLFRKDRHFTEFIDAIQPLYDPAGYFSILKKKD
ncbi:MAG: winged helix-turn-helix domain-containing protein [Nanoarchaeota archaeon]